MITDEVKIIVHAGKGGDGVVAFNKIKMSLGPTGGRGGKGGDVFFEAVSDLTALNRYKQKKDYYATDGKNGKGDNSTGHDGKDLILRIPIGSVIKNTKTNQEIEVISSGQKILVASGGMGGRGNFSFRSPSNTSPQEFETGTPGEEFEFFIELRLIADIGLIGLPNAGKSSLLNELTKANVRVADYPFTTLEPNLGTLGNIIIADIPGLIEGASVGKGLGIKFLKHIQRTKVLVHCISLESDDLEQDYKVVRKELESYSKELSQKKEIILLTKSDLVSSEIVEEKLKQMKKNVLEVKFISIHDWEGLKELSERLVRLKNLS